LSWLRHHKEKRGDCVVSYKLDTDDIRKSIPTIGATRKVNDHLNLKWKLENLKAFTFSGTVKVNDHVKLGFGTGFEFTKEGVKSITGDGSFKLPLGFSLDLKS